MSAGPSPVRPQVEGVGVVNPAYDFETMILDLPEVIENFYNMAPCGYHSLDDEGRIVRMNETELGWLGYRREELLGRPYPFVLTPEGGESFRKAYEGFKIRGSARNVEISMQRKDGTRFTALLNASAVYDDAGNYVLSRATVFDISEHKRREAELNQRAETSASRYRVIFDHNPLPMWITDIETFAFLDVNEAAVNQYGYTREEFLRMTTKDIRLSEDIPAYLEAISRSAIARRLPSPSRHRTKTGKLLEVEIVSLDLEFDGRAARLIVTHDVTEKKRLEANLLRSQRLESLGTLAGGIAHDLNNLLSPINMSLYLLRSKVTDAHGRELLAVLEQSVERGIAMVGQIVSFAKGVEGKRVPLSLKRIVREIAGVLHDTFPKSIEIRMHAPGPLCEVDGDPTQLYQVLMNLCINARDAMPDGGTLTIRLEEVDVNESHIGVGVGVGVGADARPGLYARLTVSDTGEGISPEIQEKMFDPFFTTKGPGEGSGLGLATTLGIVRNHGGFIQFHSEIGEGATFHAYLPASAGQPDEDVRREVAAERRLFAGAGELILLVDDEPAILRLAREVLEDAGYRVLSAHNGREALQHFAAQSREIKLVLTDMVMPATDGAAMIRELRRMDGTLPVLASSGLADLGKEEEARRLGVAGFLPKPYSAETLRRAVADALARDALA
jgi:two-component system, cell cycle sensor histidine kinase and response regulator CckA